MAGKSRNPSHEDILKHMVTWGSPKRNSPEKSLAISGTIYLRPSFSAWISGKIQATYGQQYGNYYAYYVPPLVGGFNSEKNVPNHQPVHVLDLLDPEFPVSMDWFSRENLNRKPMGFYYQINRAFRLKFSHHPVLWIMGFDWNYSN